MIKAAQALERVGAVKPATANINLALAHHLTLGAVAPVLAQVLINTPAPARATPAVWERLVVVSIPNAIQMQLFK